MDSYLADEFVYGWPQKHCGCAQIIESCSYCCGSFKACSSCPYCLGKAYVETPCTHSRVSTRVPAAAITPAPWAAARPHTPPSPPSQSMPRYQPQNLSIRGLDGPFGFTEETNFRSSSSGSRSSRSSRSSSGRSESPESPASPTTPSSPSPSSSSSSSSSSTESPSKRRGRSSRYKKGADGGRSGGKGSPKK